MGKKQKQEQYAIKQIIDRKDQTTAKGSTITYYKILWQGYPDEQATWEKASSLTKSIAVKKDIENFNNKRKTIQKVKTKSPQVNVTKQNIKGSKKVSQIKLLVTSTVQPNEKRDIELENNTQRKLHKSSVIANEKIDANQKNKQPQKNADSKQNDVVVTKILAKMRQNVSAEKLQSKKPSEETITQLEAKVKDNIKKVPKSKKNIKQPKKISTQINLQSKLKKTLTLKPIVQQSETQQEVPLLHIVPQSKTVSSPVKSSQSKDAPILTASCVNRIIDQIIEEKSSLQKSVQKTVQDNKSSMHQKIKLELADQFNDNVSFKDKQSLIGHEQLNNSFQGNELIIKGMMVCKNEYFYLVQENGKSQILSRAVMLDKYPYELIVFYEKRIKIKPAEINMMIL